MITLSDFGLLFGKLFGSRKPVVSEIKPLLDRMALAPDEFQLDQYHLKHVPSGVAVWIANGLNHYRLGTGGRGFSESDKKLFHAAFGKWQLLMRTSVVTGDMQKILDSVK